MIDERRCMDCCEQDCKDKCFKECYCNDDNNGNNLIWLIILIVIIYCLFCGDNKMEVCLEDCFNNVFR